MTKKPFQEYLSLYGERESDNPLVRRTNFKYLYDFYQHLVVVVGENLCSLPTGAMRQGLPLAWGRLQIHFSTYEDYWDWNKIIKKINDIRNDIEHKMDYFPPEGTLAEIREKAPEFRDWIVASGRRYRKESENFDHFHAFMNMWRNYFSIVEELFPEAYNKESTDPLEQMELEDIEAALTESKVRLVDPTKTKVTKEDLFLLERLINAKSRIDVRESTLLSMGLCPKCGAKIIETNKSYGNPGEEPTSIHYRVGCEKCGYTVHSEVM